MTDHDQLELSTVAQALIALGCGDNLARAINAGMDGHLMLAADLLQTSYEDARARYKAGDKHVKHMRQLAKVANFGFPGGLGAPGFVAHALDNFGVRVTLEEARWLRDTWLSRWVEFRKYFDKISNATRSGSTTIQQLYSGRLRGITKRAYTEACNTFFQGLGGDLTSDVLYEIQLDTRRKPVIDAREALEAWAEFRYRYGRVDKFEPFLEGFSCHPRDVTNAFLYGARVENYIHDEYLLAVAYRPLREGALVVDPILEAIALAKEYVIRTTAEKWLPDMKPTATAEAAKRWSKSSREIRDEYGRLIVWETCPEVDALAIGDLSSPWAARVAKMSEGCDPIRLHARLASLVPGYRQTPSDRDVRAVIEESRAK